ncbi:MAG: hypothetical protein IIU19_00650 [Oscillospiraceae bacterium]|nr:hypothetical protein [Oscillospiraceae bacterium]
MAYSEAAYAYANAELEKRKQAAAMRTMEMREKIRSTVPGFTSAERERMSLGMLRMRAKLSGDTAEADRLAEGLEEIRKRIDGCCPPTASPGRIWRTSISAADAPTQESFPTDRSANARRA